MPGCKISTCVSLGSGLLPSTLCVDCLQSVNLTFSGIRFMKPMEKRYTHALLFGKQYLVDIYSTACGEYVKCHLYEPGKELKEENSITERLLGECDEAVRGKDSSRKSKK